AVNGAVPHHWTLKNKPYQTNSLGSRTDVQDLLTDSAAQDSSANGKKLAPEEQSTAEYKNFHILRVLLHSFTPSFSPV
ncbi:hypothetical protein OFB79_26800, partial [Escherichia coli]|nr:hypothetical protein [Escherichia coli]